MTGNEFFEGRFALLKELNICGGKTGPEDMWGRSRYTNFLDSGWDGVYDNAPEDLQSPNPLQPSKYRIGGYAMWDFIMANGHSQYRTELDSRKFLSQSFLRPIRGFTLNTFWPELETLVSRRVKEIPWSINLMDHRDGRTILNDIHTLAHFRREELPIRSTWEKQHTANADNMVKSAAEVGASLLFDLPLNFSEAEPTTRLPYGIAISYSAHAGFSQQAPLLQFPIATSNLDLCDKVFVVLHMRVDIGCDPIEDILLGHAPHTWNDWWAFQPCRVTALGWETMDVVAAMDVVYSDRNSLLPSKAKGMYAMHPMDLFPPNTLKYYLDLAKTQLSEPDGRSLENWRLSSDHTLLERRTPFLPCNACYLKNRMIDSMISVPMTKAPKNWKDVPEWDDYRKSVKLAMKHVANAKREYYPGNFIQDRAQHRRRYETEQKRLRKLELRRKRF